MRAIFVGLRVCLFALFLPTLAVANELSALQTENYWLNAELELAKATKMYIVLDLSAKAISFKAGGVEIKRLPIEHSRVSDVSPTPIVRRLSAKISANQPKRPQVVIMTEEQVKAAPAPAPGTDGLVALEIKDMPEIYQLQLDDGLMLAVKAPPSGDFKAKATRYWQDGVNYAKSWYQSIRNKIQGVVGEPQIAMNLSGLDARQLYWSFDEGMPCLIKN